MPKKILVADDEADFLKVVIARLAKRGYEVISAANGKEAVELIQQHHPDLILLDFKMPHMDGEQVCQWVKANEQFKKIPVLFMTASTEFFARDIMKQSLAVGYLVKPFEPNDLFERVQKLVGEPS